MRILLTGGGTAGHVNPAIAIAQIIKENDPKAEIAFAGTPKGIENRLVEKEGYRMYHANSMGISRNLSPKNIYALWLAFYSPIKAKKFIREFAPDIVIGTGGYVCWPVLKAASALNIPTAVHESNVVPGFAIRMLENYVDKILLNFEKTKEFLKHPEKSVTVGNPMRTGFSVGSGAMTRERLGINENEKLILSFGGSLGADAINNACIEMMSSYVKNTEGVYHIHASGDKNYGKCKEKFDSLNLQNCKRIKLEKYINNMPELMSASDAVISRAGAMTLSELALTKKASILIPSPNVTNNHQYKNAKALADKNAAILIEEKNLTAEALTQNIKSIFEDSAKSAELQNNISLFALQDANRKVYEEILKLI